MNAATIENKKQRITLTITEDDVSSAEMMFQQSGEISSSCLVIQCALRCGLEPVLAIHSGVTMSNGEEFEIYNALPVLSCPHNLWRELAGWSFHLEPK